MWRIDHSSIPVNLLRIAAIAIHPSAGVFAYQDELHRASVTVGIAAWAYCMNGDNGTQNSRCCAGSSSEGAQDSS